MRKIALQSSIYGLFFNFLSRTGNNLYPYLRCMYLLMRQIHTFHDIISPSGTGRSAMRHCRIRLRSCSYAAQPHTLHGGGYFIRRPSFLCFGYACDKKMIKRYISLFGIHWRLYAYMKVMRIHNNASFRCHRKNNGYLPPFAHDDV